MAHERERVVTACFRVLARANWKNRAAVFRLWMIEGFIAKIKNCFRYVKFEKPVRLQAEFM